MKFMHPRNMHLIAISTAAVTVLIAATVSACDNSKSYGPYSSSQMVAKLHELKRTVPVHVLPQSSPLVAVFRYIDLTSETWLVSYFGSKQPNGQVERVARMRTSVSLMAFDGALENSRAVRVAWAKDSRADTCTPRADIFDGDEFPGNPYQTCLVWFSGGYYFLLYSTLPVDETVSLANSLEQVQ